MGGRPKKDAVAYENERKYLISPSWEKIRSFIKQECKVTYAHFERFFGIPKNTLNLVRAGIRKLPSKYWHIIYEKITDSRTLTNHIYNNKGHRKCKKKVKRKPSTPDDHIKGLI
jgi:hypothetical protein